MVSAAPAERLHPRVYSVEERQQLHVSFQADLARQDKGECAKCCRRIAFIHANSQSQS